MGSSTSKDSNHAWHLAPAVWFNAQPSDADYLPEAYADSGFIHLTFTTADVIDVGNRYYRAVAGGWLALWIALDQTAAPVQFADSDPQRRFPHLHGPLERHAIVSIHAVHRAEDGTFLAIDDQPTASASGAAA